MARPQSKGVFEISGFDSAKAVLEGVSGGDLLRVIFKRVTGVKLIQLSSLGGNIVFSDDLNDAMVSGSFGSSGLTHEIQIIGMIQRDRDLLAEILGEIAVSIEVIKNGVFAAAV